MAQEEASVLTLRALASLKVRNVEKVIVMYVRSVRMVREGANCIIRTIQPR